ncbi:MAG: peptidase [Bacillales bacterium]|jgi:stage II sporulation protein Q|nr:peptidase [Bacillales bacterium]
MREEENKKSSPKGVNLVNKKWFYPALYVAVVSILLIVAFVMQATSDRPIEVGQPKDTGSGSKSVVPVTKKEEVMQMPMLDDDMAVIQKKFYDDKMSAEEQEAALVSYNNTFTPNTGIDITTKEGKSFDVVAALSGTVTSAEKDPVLGNIVTIDHGNGFVTYYQSLGTVAVEPGSQVDQGQVIATAGTSLVNKEAGNHVHFELRKDGVAVNPADVMNKTLSSVSEVK